MCIHRVRTTLALIELASVGLLGCGGRPSVAMTDELTPQSPVNRYIPTSFGADPTPYLGRFVPDGTPRNEIDETMASKLTCSQYLKIVRVNGAGMESREEVTLSAAAAASLGLGGIGATARGAASRQALMSYRLKEKWIADVADPAAFEACCRSAPDQCTSSYVGEFLVGTGKLSICDSASVSAEGGVAGLGAQANGSQRRCDDRIFAEDVAFAFKLTEVHNPCASLERQAQAGVAVGQSEWVRSERAALDDARIRARKVVEAAGPVSERTCVESRADGNRRLFRAKALVVNREEPVFSRGLGWAVGGVGIAGLLVGGGFMANSAARDGDASNAGTSKAFDNAKADAVQSQKLGFALLGVGAAAAGVAVWRLFVYDGPDEDIAIVPSSGAAGVGAAVNGRF